MPKSFKELFNDFVFLGESKSPDLRAILESISRQISALKPRTSREERAVKMALYELKQAKLEARRLNERVRTLEEAVTLLENGE